MGCNPRISTSVGIVLSFLSWISSLLSFFLPHWVIVDEALVAPKSLRISSTEMIQLQYNYGFWKYCSSMTSSTLSSNVCGDIVTHQGWEQIIICMVLLAALLHLSSILTSFLFLLIFDDEPLCLYVAGASMGVAGMLLLTAVVTYGTQNRNIIDVTDAYLVPFKTSHLGASFWCATSSCIISLVICILFLAATTNVSSTSVRHSIPLATRRRFRRYGTGQSLEMTRVTRNNSPRGGEDNVVSLYRMPFNTNSSIFDLHLKDAIGTKESNTPQQLYRNDTVDDSCNDVLYSKIRMKENGDIKTHRDHEPSSSRMKYFSNLQNNLDYTREETSNTLPHAGPSNLYLREYNRLDNNDARFAQIDGQSKGPVYNASTYSSRCALVPGDKEESIERNGTPVAISPRRAVVAQIPSQSLPRYAWIDAECAR